MTLGKLFNLSGFWDGFLSCQGNSEEISIKYVEFQYQERNFNRRHSLLCIPFFIPVSLFFPLMLNLLIKHFNSHVKGKVLYRYKLFYSLLLLECHFSDLYGFLIIMPWKASTTQNSVLISSYCQCQSFLKDNTQGAGRMTATNSVLNSLVTCDCLLLHHMRSTLGQTRFICHALCPVAANPLQRNEK